MLYRGTLRTYCCNSQLRSFWYAVGKLIDVNARFVTLSVDDEVTNAELVAELWQR